MLSVVGLSKRYGSRQVLDDVSFEARRGRIVGFLGPNGAGKTTAMRSIFGLVRPEAGQILWGGAPIGHEERLRFGYMPEQRGLYPKMRIGEQLEYLARLSGLPGTEAKAAATSWLDRLGLGERAHDQLEALSHGNQQRVQLAAALVHDPDLAVLDEPFSGLDPIGVQAMAVEVRSMAARGATIVFSSHQLDLVEDVCEDVVIINEGRIVRSGELDQVRNAAVHRRLAVTVDGVPWRPTRVPAETVSNTSGGRHMLVPKEVPLDDVLAEAREAGTVTSLSYEPPSLTDIFHEAVAR